jgi:hypothetical protein
MKHKLNYVIKRKFFFSRIQVRLREILATGYRTYWYRHRESFTISLTYFTPKSHVIGLYSKVSHLKKCYICNASYYQIRKTYKHM